MKVLQTVKYYDPSKGGMESVVKNIVEGVNEIDKKCVFTIYSNHHYSNFRRQTIIKANNTIVKEKTPFILKSQPLNAVYASLRKLIMENDVIHHHYPFPNMELALLRNLDVLKEKKLIITWHANIKNSRWSWIKRYYEPIIKKLLDLAYSVVITSPQLFEASDILIDYKDKVKVIPLSFDPKHITTIKPRKYPTDKKFNLLFVGKLRKYKGIEYLIHSVAQLNVTLTIVGNGEEELSLKNLADKLDISDRVLFVNNVDNSQLQEYYRLADLFVLPSINEAEAFGVVQLEAMAHGLPVINTQLDSGVPYVSLNNLTGITVQPRNISALTEAIRNIQNTPSMYETFSENAIKRVNDFTQKKMAESYLDLYSI